MYLYYPHFLVLDRARHRCCLVVAHLLFTRTSFKGKMHTWGDGQSSKPRGELQYRRRCRMWTRQNGCIALCRTRTCSRVPRYVPRFQPRECSASPAAPSSCKWCPPDEHGTRNIQTRNKRKRKKSMQIRHDLKYSNSTKCRISIIDFLRGVRARRRLITPKVANHLPPCRGPNSAPCLTAW